MSDKKWTRRAAIGFIGAGTGLFATDTAGFTQIEGARDVDLGSEEDPGGLVGFSAETDVSGNPDERVDLFTLKNNFSDGDNSDDPLSINNIVINAGNEYVDNIKIGDEGISQNAPIDIEDNATVNGVLRLSSGVDEVENEEAKFEISASQNGVRFELDRTVTVTVQEGEFYSNPDNYSDNRDRGSGKAPQPEPDKAKGVVIEPANIGRDGGFTTLQSSNKDRGLKVGFRLPMVSPEDEYVLTIKTKRVTGGLVAYIVNEGGEKLSCEIDIKRNTEEYHIQADNTCTEDGKISDDKNRNNLFLIFEAGSTGNNESKIRFIELLPNPE